MAQDADLAEGHAEDQRGLQDGVVPDDLVNVVDGLHVALLTVLQVLHCVIDLGQVLVQAAHRVLQLLGSLVRAAGDLGLLAEEGSAILVGHGHVNVNGLVGGAAGVREADGVVPDLDGLEGDLRVALALDGVQLLALGSLDDHVDGGLGVVKGLCIVHLQVVTCGPPSGRYRVVELDEGRSIGDRHVKACTVLKRLHPVGEGERINSNQQQERRDSRTQCEFHRVPK